MSQRIAIDVNAAATLPLRAAHCLLFVAAREHRRAIMLCYRSAGEHSKNQKRRSRRMGVASRLAEAFARDTAAEARA
ncbi:hypothetical protein H7691_06575 [Stenotrophomonas sp. CW117]|uniref:hypothetical protein n=1 Tax=Stenotrophomonas TaxID=40323 RepID=UPI001782E736|nr:hypothetical protein [Stenotrophomonas sp. CW117]QOF99774.1 hypothetical protein H7691_06575 [Stenotrophomonas sp. CW117]